MRDRSIRAIGATIVLLGLGIAALVQMGPGGDPSAIAIIPEDTTTTTQTGVEDTGAVVSTSPDEQAAPFTYRMGVLSSVSTDNFWAFYGGQASVWNSYILGPTKPTLYEIDPEDGSLIPELAVDAAEPSFDSESWFVEVDLSDSLSWSDGRPITAHDLVFTFETVRDLSLGGSWAAAFPESVTAIHAESSHRLRIDFGERPPFAVWPNAVGTAPVMPKHIWESAVAGMTATELYAESGTGDVSGGPLALANISGELVRSIANPGYPAQTTPDVVTYEVYPDEASAVAALDRGEIEAILSPKGLSIENTVTAEANPHIAVEASPANGVRYLGFNLRREPMAEPAFRTALALLLDRLGLAETLAEGSGVAHSFIREANSLWHDPARAETIEEMYAGSLQDRLARALDGLRQAGYVWQVEPSLGDDGALQAGAGLTIRGAEPTPLTILTPGDAYDPARPEYVEAIAETLRMLGLDARPVVTDFDTVVDLAFASAQDGGGEYDMYMLGWTLGSPALPDYYRPLFASDGEMNNTGYSSTPFDERLAAYESAYTLEDARRHLWDMEETLARDIPYLLLYTTEIFEAYRSDRVTYGIEGNIGGIQGRLGGIADVTPAP